MCSLVASRSLVRFVPPPYPCTWRAVLNVQRYLTQLSLITRFAQKANDANIFMVTREWVVSIELCV